MVPDREEREEVDPAHPGSLWEAVHDANVLSERDILDLKVLASLFFGDHANSPTCEELCRRPDPEDQVGGAEVRARDMRQAGCEGESELEYHLYDGSTFRFCPRRIQRGPLVEVVASYMWFTKHGIFPAAGGLVDQPGPWVDSMRILDGAYNRIEAIRQEREQRKRLQAPISRKGRR